MPELPEVETMRRGILDIVGSSVTAVEMLPCARRPIAIRPALEEFRHQSVGQRVIAVDRIGKRVAIRLANDHRILFEPRMTGLVLRNDPPSEEHLRFRLDLRGGPIPHVWYWDRRGLGNVRLVSADELTALLAAQRLGPDALAVDAQEFRERLRKTRREIKVALLDQRAIAGIGNLYAAEILHRSGIHPQARCHRLSAEQWERMHAAMVEILETAIRYEGSTLSDGTYRNVLNQAGGYQNQHRVYARAGERCPVCRDRVVERIVQAQRATFYCRGCQKRK